LESGNWPDAEREPKWVLKAPVARQVSPELVYRKKSGYVAPIEEHFERREFLSGFCPADRGAIHLG
jgi:hypothetical protein